MSRILTLRRKSAISKRARKSGGALELCNSGESRIQAQFEQTPGVLETSGKARSQKSDGTDSETIKGGSLGTEEEDLQLLRAVEIPKGGFDLFTDASSNGWGFFTSQKVGLVNEVGVSGPVST